jgi:hypothetical protein
MGFFISDDRLNPYNTLLWKVELVIIAEKKVFSDEKKGIPPI